MDSEFLNISKKIFVNLSNNDIDNFRYTSQIVDIVDDETIIISSPFYMSNIFIIDIMQSIKFLTVVDTGLYIYECINIERIVEKNIILYKIKILSQPQRYQRRNFYRLEIELPVIYQYLTGNEESYGQGVTIDISGGGIKFICPDILSNEQIVNVFLRLDENSHVDAKVKVVRCDEIAKNKYVIGVEFIDIASNVREDIVKYIFTVQREILRKRNNK